MKIKTAKLQGAALDWAVAKCDGVDVWREPDGIYLCEGGEVGFMFRPSTDWALAGPIIERERIALFIEYPSNWGATDGNRRMPGDTPLIAAMRCYVASKLGDEVDVPDQLIQGA